jgi:predicted nucleotide-binding protein
MNQHNIINVLRQLKSDADILMQKPSYEDFRAWQQKIGVVFEEAFGKEDELLTRLRVGTYNAPAMVRGQSPNLRSEAVLSGIKRTNSLIDAALLKMDLRYSNVTLAPTKHERDPATKEQAGVKSYYHVRIQPASTKTGSAIKFDMSEPELVAKVIAPYEAGTTITLSGRNIDPFSIDRITISKSNEPSTHLRAVVESKLAGPHFSYIPRSIDENVLSEGEDVTDLYITGAPGSKARIEEIKATDDKGGDEKTVFVIHGRDAKPLKALTELLSSVSLHPLEWAEVKLATGEASPYIGTILDKGFALAQAAIVLFTPDDEAILKEQFWSRAEPEYEKHLKGQARPNVLYEAGMAMALFPKRTVLVEMGELRPFSDIEGRHTIRMDNSPSRRQELLSALKAAGCIFTTDGKTRWLNAGDFEVTSKEKT